MGDVIFVATIVAFFALAAAYVGACARIIGPDEPVGHQPEPAEPEGAAAEELLAARGAAR